MKIKDQTRKLAAGCSKHGFDVVDRTDEVSNIYTARRRWRGLKRFSKSINSSDNNYLTPILKQKLDFLPKCAYLPPNCTFWIKKIGRTSVLPTKNMLLKGNWFFTDTLGKLRTNKSLIVTFVTSYLLLQFLMSLLFLSHLWYNLFTVRIDNTVLNYDS